MIKKINLLQAVFIGICIFMLIFSLSVSTSSCSRMKKSFDSNMNGELEKVVVLYNNDGRVIKTWQGKIDLIESEEEIMFDLNGKRVIIHGGIVIVQEISEV